MIRIAGDQATIEDLSSKNGTWLGPVRVVGPTPLADGMELRLGSAVAVARFRRHPDTTETAAFIH